MAYKFKWNIEGIEGYPRHPEHSELSDVVSNVFWQLEVRWVEDGSVHYLRGSTEIGSPNPSSFTDHLELSDEDVLGFVWNVIGGREEAENIARDQLAELMSPPETKVQALSMPWNADCCPDGEGIDELSGIAATTRN